VLSPTQVQNQKTKRLSKLSKEEKKIKLKEADED